jgi:hypothetical protein
MEEIKYFNNVREKNNLNELRDSNNIEEIKIAIKSTFKSILNLRGKI